MAGKFINRYQSFCISLASLEQAKYRDPSDDFVLSGTIQKFSLTFDISWKVMKDILVKYHGLTNFATGSPRETLRTAKSVGLISDDIWLDMLEDRNELVYDYDGSLAADSFQRIITRYIDTFTAFQSIAAEYIEKIKAL